MSAGPPRVLRRLLEAVLPSDVQEGIVGDLDEVYRHRRTRRGRWITGLWYGGQVVAIAGRFAVDRAAELLSIRGLSFGLDLKIGLRMMARTPMLTVVGGIAVTVATALGVGTSEFVRDMVAPTLPLDDGDRIVRVYHDDAESGGATPATLYDLEVWRASVPSLESWGAYTTLEQGIVTEGGEAGTVSLARISASAFDLARVPPRIGRGLIADDASPGAPPVVVLGHPAWQAILGGDPDPVGRIVHLGGTPTTVVGVMPEGFGFPQSQTAWTPLRVDEADLGPETASRANVFARLAPGATLESARAELEGVGRRLAGDAPAVYERLTPRVAGFAQRASAGQTALLLTGVRLLFVFLLVVACANVATLVFARTVMREGEIAIRSSLGATRRRIVLQLFAEALVLVGIATGAGLLLARLSLGRISRLFFTIQQEPRPPFWWNDALSPSTVAYALALAFVGALMIGVVPALKATRTDVRPRLGRAGGSAGALRFGGMWTVVIVLQVALSVAFLPLAVAQAGAAFEEPADSGFPAERYVTAQLGRDPSVPPRTPGERAAFHDGSLRLFREVRDRLADDPAVRGVALASGLSAMNHLATPFDFEGAGDGTTARALARVLLVDPSYLELLGARVVAGRPLGAGDFTAESRSVVVNEAFVDQVMGGRNPVGGRLRVPDDRRNGSTESVPAAGTAVDVVGVVADPGIDRYGPGAHPAVYAPLDWAPVTPRAVGLVGMPQAPSVQLFVDLRPETGAWAARLYEVTTAVDPALRLSEVGTTAEAWRSVHVGGRLGGWIFAAVAGIVLMLSVAGIYALMSFTVSRRTREIAIRSAMGARRGEIVGIVFRRAVTQLLAGVALGSFVAVPALRDGVADEGPRTLVVVSVLLVGAGLAACSIPVRRALAVEPAAAMKADG